MCMFLSTVVSSGREESFYSGQENPFYNSENKAQHESPILPDQEDTKHDFLRWNIWKLWQFGNFASVWVRVVNICSLINIRMVDTQFILTEA